MIDFEDKYTQDLHNELVQRFFNDGRPIALGLNRSGNPKPKTQEFLDFLAQHDIEQPYSVKTPQMLTILYNQYTDDDVLCPECGSFKQTMSSVHLPVYCSTRCYKQSDDGRAKISKRKRELYSDPEWKKATEAKKIQSNQKRFGRDHAMQNPESFEKQKKSSFQAHTRDGLLLQGYEPQVVDYLNRLYGYELENGTEYLKRTNQRVVWVDDAGNEHYTYPDLYVPEINSFVEVKGAYTREKDNEKIIRTAQACRDKGWGYCVITHYPQHLYFKFVTESM